MLTRTAEIEQHFPFSTALAPQPLNLGTLLFNTFLMLSAWSARSVPDILPSQHCTALNLFFNPSPTHQGPVFHPSFLSTCNK